MLRDRIEAICAEHREHARVAAETGLLLRNAGLITAADRQRAVEDVQVGFVRQLEYALREEPD